MTTRRDFLAGALAATTAFTLSRPARAQGAARTGKIKARDDTELFVRDSGGSGRAVVMTHAPTAAGIAQAKMIEYQGSSHGMVLTERDRVTRDLQSFVAS